MTDHLDIEIDDREFRVEFDVHPREPQTYYDPGTPGGIEIVAVWEHGKPAVTTDAEDDQIVQAIKDDLAQREEIYDEPD